MRPDIVQPSRRGLILGLGASLITAPAIVRAASLMPVKALQPELSPFGYLGAQAGAIVLAGSIYSIYMTADSLYFHNGNRWEMYSAPLTVP